MNAITRIIRKYVYHAEVIQYGITMGNVNVTSVSVKINANGSATIIKGGVMEETLLEKVIDNIQIIVYKDRILVEEVVNGGGGNGGEFDWEDVVEILMDKI